MLGLIRLGVRLPWLYDPLFLSAHGKKRSLIYRCIFEKIISLLVMEDLRILLIGNGGREHALAWKLSLSPRGTGGLALKIRRVTSLNTINASISNICRARQWRDCPGFG